MEMETPVTSESSQGQRQRYWPGAVAWTSWTRDLHVFRRHHLLQGFSGNGSVAVRLRRKGCSENVVRRIAV